VRARSSVCVIADVGTCTSCGGVVMHCGRIGMGWGGGGEWGLIRTGRRHRTSVDEATECRRDAVRHRRPGHVEKEEATPTQSPGKRRRRKTGWEQAAWRCGGAAVERGLRASPADGVCCGGGG
jgi:hypothetical protein